MNNGLLANSFIKAYITIGLLYFALFANAQPFKRFDYLPVSQNGNTLLYPWTGGVNNVQFGKADVNHDGLKDLIVYDKNNNKILTFLANGNNSTTYTFNSNYTTNFPPIYGWIVMKDYNCDGIEDIFTYNGIGNIMVYTGYYNNDTLKYKLQQDGVYYNGISGAINVYCSEVIKPAIADFNNDGDLDIISFNVFYNRLIYYENQQKELSLSCDSLFFKKMDNCWGNVQDTFGAAYSLRDTCNYKFLKINGTTQIEHTGSILEAIDLDNNGVKDILVGSVTLNGLTMLYNAGTKQYASILNQDINYPSNTVPFNVSSFASPVFIDVNNDNKTDLLVSTFDVGAANINNIWYYQNIATSANQPIQLKYQQNNFLLDNMIDAGENSNPCFTDVDGDGLIDILLGSGGFKDNINPPIYKLLYYKNTGTATQPKYNLENDDFLSINTLGLKDIAPTVGDIDNDGDNDLLIGTSDGKIAYWQNIATLGNPPNYVYNGYLKDATQTVISIGYNATPCVADINKDGKNDLIIGERNGNLNYYKGNSNNSVNLSWVTDSLGKILIKTNNISIGYTQPTIADFNKDGKLDLLLGTNYSGLQFYDNIEDKLNNKFTLSTPLINTTDLRTTATWADINNDGKPELLTGNTNGGLIIYSQDPPQNIYTAVKNNTKNTIKFTSYPNPANNNITLILDKEFKSIKLQIINLLGQVILQNNYLTTNTITINVNDLENGIYFFKIMDDENEGVQKISIIH